MAIKLTIHEICPKCGRVAARQNNDGTVHTIVHGCVVKGKAPRSFLPSEVIFVPASELNNVAELVIAYHELQDKNRRLSADLSEMASDCARLQKVLLDIGFKVRDVLGVDISKEVSGFRKGSWQCSCDMWNGKNLDSCCNCGISKTTMNKLLIEKELKDEIILLRKNAEYEDKHIKALWDENRSLWEACGMAVDVISGRIDNASDPHSLGRWNEECDVAVKKLNGVLSVEETQCWKCGEMITDCGCKNKSP